MAPMGMFVRMEEFDENMFTEKFFFGPKNPPKTPKGNSKIVYSPIIGPDNEILMIDGKPVYKRKYMIRFPQWCVTPKRPSKASRPDVTPIEGSICRKLSF